MSPEQAKGEKLDGRSDVYALGCVMYAMLEGDAPFRGKKALDVAMMHINNPFPAIQEKVPLALREIIMKCVEKKASSRYCDVNDLAAALEAFLDPIECRRREAGDAWTVRRSTPPEASKIAQFGSSVQSALGVASPNGRCFARTHANGVISTRHSPREFVATRRRTRRAKTAHKSMHTAQE